MSNLNLSLPQKHSVQGTTIFTVMTALANEHHAINLAQGFPDFPLDQELCRHLYEAALHGFNQYAPMPGLPMLRQAIATDFKKRYNTEVSPENEVTVTPGATYAIYAAFTAILEPGDEAIILEPAYDSYIPNIEMNGAKVVPVPLAMPDFHVDWQRVKDAVTAKTKAIIINTPQNPTGAVWTKQDWDELADIVRDTRVFIISDEVYEQLVFDGLKHYSVLEHEELRQRSFAIYSFGKVFNNTGWKTGFCIAPPMLTKAFRSVHQFVAFCTNTPLQYAIARYLDLNTAEPVGAMMQRKRDFFLSLIGNTPFTIKMAAKGSYFQVAGYENISDLPDMEFAAWLTKEYGVATIPISPFYSNRKDDKIVRFCFAKKEETLAKAVERLSTLKAIR